MSKLDNYERDSLVLDEVYRSALSILEQQFKMDDECKSKLVATVLKIYFSELEQGEEKSLSELAGSVAARFIALLPG